MNKYDVVIVGGGPAGLNCAHHLERSGNKVLLLEQKPGIGPKVCAGGLSRRDLEYLDIPGTLPGIAFKRARMSTPKYSNWLERNYVIARTLDREILGQWMLARLQKTDVRTNGQVTGVSPHMIEVNKKEQIEFKYLVGADGSSSCVRRYLKIPTKLVAMGMQYVVPKNFSDLEVFFEPRLLKAGYAWIFPHQEHDSVGCCCSMNYLPPQKLRKNFHRFLIDRKIDVSRGKYQSHLINYDYRGLRFGDFFLVGDAAGLSAGLSGEGIFGALVSGEEAARMMRDRAYRPQKLPSVLKYKAKQERYMEILGKSGIMIRTRLMDRLVRKLKKDGFQEKVINFLA